MTATLPQSEYGRLLSLLSFGGKALRSDIPAARARFGTIKAADQRGKNGVGDVAPRDGALPKAGKGEQRVLTLKEKTSIGILVVFCLVYGAHGFVTLYQGAYWSAGKSSPPVLYRGMQAALMSCSEIATAVAVGCVLVSSFTAQRRLAWAVGIAAVAIVIGCYVSVQWMGRPVRI